MGGQSDGAFAVCACPVASMSPLGASSQNLSDHCAFFEDHPRQAAPFLVGKADLGDHTSFLGFGPDLTIFFDEAGFAEKGRGLMNLLDYGHCIQYSWSGFGCLQLFLESSENKALFETVA